MTKAVFLLGLAGAGKTWVTYSLWEWFKSIKQDVAILNLDPGVTYLPYEPAIDIREFINIWSLMEKYNVGPNGALMLSMDLLIEYLEKINFKVGEINPGLLLVDTPGQMEIFAYRASGKIIIDNLSVDDKMVIYVMDAVFNKDPRNFISSFLIGGSIKIRFETPMLAVLNKIDLLSDDELKNILRWVKKPHEIMKDLETHYPTEEGTFLYRIYGLIRKYGLFQDFITVSAMYLTNFSQLVQALTRVLYGGEEYFEL